MMGDDLVFDLDFAAPVQVLNQEELACEANNIRSLLENETDTCLCEVPVQQACACNAIKMPVPMMDVRERKWAAAKLLQPVATGMGDFGDDLSEAEFLLMCIEYWKFLAPAYAETQEETDDRIIRQLRHSRDFVCRAWNIAPPPHAEISNIQPQ